jgi:hypothetical protein
MSKTISNVPIKHVIPGPTQVLVRQYDANQTEGGLHLPEVAQAVIHVAEKVGEDVKHVKEGDIVLLYGAAQIAGLAQVKELCALIPGDAIGGVIRGYDWRTAALGTKKRALQ